jgi:non-ribosomal peptide synthetase-like protein
VELSEIENVLMESPAIRAAATVARECRGVQQLVAYVVPANDTPPDETPLRAHLRQRLPSYMVPAIVETVESLPMLPSGKVDRARLPALRPRAAKTTDASQSPSAGLEEQIAGVWAEAFGLPAVSRRDHFFHDLGGHSLLVARVVSELRAEPALADLSMADVYHYPTVEELAARCAQRRTEQEAKTPKKRGRVKRATASAAGRRHAAAWLQLAGLYLLLELVAVEWLLPIAAYHSLAAAHLPRFVLFAATLAAPLALIPLMFPLAIAAKWLLLGRVRAGSYPLWGWFYVRWWLAGQIRGLAPVHYLAGTPLMNLFCRLMGGKIGQGVFLGTEHFAAFDLLSIAEDTSVGSEACLLGYTVQDGLLKIGPIHIGRRCFVGSRAVLACDAGMEDDASLLPLSLLPTGGRIPRGQKWGGSPARPVHDQAVPAAAPAASAPCGGVRKFTFGVLHAVGVLILPTVFLTAALPDMALMSYLAPRMPGQWYLLAAPLGGAVFLASFCLEIALIKWLLLGRLRAGTYPLQSGLYLRKWFVDQLMDMTLTLTGQIYASLYLPFWLRLMGARIGRFAEISTAHALTPDLLEIDRESFIADAVSLGAAHVERGRVTLSALRVGRRTFVGNSACVAGGCRLGDGSLIGVLTVPPRSEAQAARPGADWLGSPAIFLPKRQSGGQFPEETTFRPTRKRVLARLSIEFLRLVLPPGILTLLAGVLVWGAAALGAVLPPLAVLAAFPLLFLACGVAILGFVIALKWILMGRFRPDSRPLWSDFVWRNELLTALHERVADPVLVRMLLGTPFVCWFFRLMGAKIGRGVYMETTALTEFDLIELGDFVALNQDCTIQTHLFEDRVMKMSTVQVGRGCSLGARSIALYDSVMEPEVILSELSLLMKGETLPEGTCWEGSPARFAPCTFTAPGWTPP